MDRTAGVEDHSRNERGKVRFERGGMEEAEKEIRSDQIRITRWDNVIITLLKAFGGAFRDGSRPTRLHLRSNPSIE